MIIQTIFADLHIHIGQDYQGKMVKISASKKLTIQHILREASERKGIELIGIVDGHVPNVLAEIEGYLQEGTAHELQEGGIQFHGTTLLLGSEIEIADASSQGPFHVLVFLPNLESMKQFSNWLKDKMTNIHLSSQRIYCSAKELQAKTKQLGGLFIPAHVFTPFKSLYGKGVVKSIAEVLDLEWIDAIELGLSADTAMADKIAELHPYPYLTNSDSHSLAKIGREYQELRMKRPSFYEFSLCLKGEKGRSIVRNYGMDPRLGKYYRSSCRNCHHSLPHYQLPCPYCQANRVLKGVVDRIAELSQANGQRSRRPAYRYQVPLDYLPGIGPKTYQRLLEAFTTEMNIIHHVAYEDLEAALGERLARTILDMRQGKLRIKDGAGGSYGRILR